MSVFINFTFHEKNYSLFMSESLEIIPTLIRYIDQRYTPECSKELLSSCLWLISHLTSDD